VDLPRQKIEIESIIKEWLRNPNVHGIVTTGGTGLGFRDVTPETLEPYFTKKIDGFGEFFRMISYEDVGTKALLSRAGAGIGEDKVVFMLPGSEKAVELAMEKHVLSELHHIVHEITNRKAG
jgi:molybdopterin adenylyltransferase